MDFSVTSHPNESWALACYAIWSFKYTYTNTKPGTICHFSAWSTLYFLPIIKHHQGNTEIHPHNAVNESHFALESLFLLQLSRHFTHTHELPAQAYEQNIEWRNKTEESGLTYVTQTTRTYHSLGTSSHRLPGFHTNHSLDSNTNSWLVPMTRWGAPRCNQHHLVSLKGPQFPLFANNQRWLGNTPITGLPYKPFTGLPYTLQTGLYLGYIADWFPRHVKVLQGANITPWAIKAHNMHCLPKKQGLTGKTHH